MKQSRKPVGCSWICLSLGTPKPQPFFCYLKPSVFGVKSFVCLFVLLLWPLVGHRVVFHRFLLSFLWLWFLDVFEVFSYGNFRLVVFSSLLFFQARLEKTSPFGLAEFQAKGRLTLNGLADSGVLRKLISFGPH